MLEPEQGVLGNLFREFRRILRRLCFREALLRLLGNELVVVHRVELLHLKKI